MMTAAARTRMQRTRNLMLQASSGDVSLDAFDGGLRCQVSSHESGWYSVHPHQQLITLRLAIH